MRNLSSKGSKLFVALAVAAVLAAPAAAVWQRFLGDISVTSVLSSGNVTVQGILSAARASFTGPVSASSMTFTGIATPSSATARTVYFDTTLDRLAYANKNGSVITVDPTYIFANNWEERPGNGTCTDSWFLSFQANTSTAIYRVSETTVKRPFGAQGTIVSMTCATNNNTQTVTLRLRKNGVNVGQGLTMAPGPVYNIAQSSGNALAIPVTSTDTITVGTTNNHNCLTGQPPAGCTLVVAPGVN